MKTITKEVQINSAMNVVIVGHVDHGKSTLIGRLFYDTGSIPPSRYEAISRVCEETGKPFEFAFLLDALEEERDQGITIDTTQVRFRTDLREYVLIDAPGHKEFLKNMVSGAASADAALLLIDAQEGVREQSRRHGYLLHLLGIRQVAVVINKMDLVGYAQDTFQSVCNEYLAFLADLGVQPQFVIPACARQGENVFSSGQNMLWYDGPTVLEALDSFSARPSREHLSLRLPVQDVYKFDNRRIIAGRIEAGTLAVGDEIIFSPSGHKGIVQTIERWNSTSDGPAEAGESIGFTLTEQLFIERGEVVSNAIKPPNREACFEANLFWLGRRHLRPGRAYTLKLATQEVECQIASILSVIDTSSLAQTSDQLEVACNEVAHISVSLKKPIAFDSFQDSVETGRFVLVDENTIAGGGIILGAIPDSYSI